jgi:transposase
MFQDETRYGLITGLKRTITAKGVKAKVHYQHSYQYLWIWGSFSPLTGDAFYWETPIVNNNIFEAYLKALGQRTPNKYIILVIDNAGFHASKNISIPPNIKLLRIPAYASELNPAEKVWQYMKSKVAMKFNESIKHLQDRLTQLIKSMDKELISSITAYDIYTKPLIE